MVTGQHGQKDTIKSANKIGEVEKILIVKHMHICMVRIIM